jgi:hypothetical protein
MPTPLVITLLIAVAAVATVAAFGARRWQSETRELRERIEAAREPIVPATIDFGELDGLPAPVQRYFRRVLVAGRPLVAGVRLRHHGTFDVGKSTAKWKPFTSDQRVVTRRPGLDWDARIAMLPGLPVRVHDAYVAGEGILHAAVLGLFTVARLRDTREMAEGELMRWLAEAAWYPTALLPSQGVRWAVVDRHSARATLADGAIALTLLFAFDDEGLIQTVHADARGRTVGDRSVPTPWQGRFWNYQERAGMVVPIEGEVAWVLPEGTKPYWRGSIVDIAYEFS